MTTQSLMKILISGSDLRCLESIQSTLLFTAMCSKMLFLLISFHTKVIKITIMSRTALGPTQPPVHWVPGALSLGVKWPGREADHSPPSSAEVKE
jgi:hypothetical protein